MTRVLIVDDEPQLRRAMSINLRERGYDIELAESGKTALELVSRTHPDVMVLDLGLPDIDGIEVIGKVREYSQVPILVLSVRDGEAVKIKALDAGADDYVTKPFSFDELLARLRSLVRRSSSGEEPTTFECEAFQLDFVNKVARSSADSAEIKLTPTEWSLVEVLVANAGNLMTHKRLLQQVWGGNYGSEANYLRVYMTQIRHKLEPDPAKPKYFLTETGMGYRFVN